jgi:endonuclease/exonuclease/phosphatase (EEP) superfamily protein YafD
VTSAMMLTKPLRLLATPLLALGTLLHLSVADAWPVTRAFFYATPLPVLALGWLAMSCLWCWRSIGGVLCVALALGCGAWWCAVSYRQPEPQSARATVLKVLSWNMAHHQLPSADLQAMMESLRPDIAGLVEVGRRHSDPNALTAALPRGYTALKLDHGMAFMVRGKARVLREVLLPSASKFACLEAVVDGVAWRVFIVDGVSRPTTSREDVLGQVLTDASGRANTVVMGDFNTPLESIGFNAWRRELHHAFNEAGSGFRETWPRWVPVLTIDHVWSSADAPPLRAEKLWRAGSDHAALLVELGRRAN